MIQSRFSATSTYQGMGAAQPSRCRVAVSGSSTGLNAELGSLLHQRLRITSLLALLPLTFFFVRNLVAPEDELNGVGVSHQVFHAIVLAIIGGTSLVVWGRQPHCLDSLRIVELVQFGALGFFFGWIQYRGFAAGKLLGVSCANVEQPLLHAAAMASMLRWFFLIVIYGVFIPNTWRRCLCLTGLAALAPLVLTPTAAALHGHLGSGVLGALPDMAVLMLTAVAVAVFGSHRIESLRKRAFQAQQLGQYKLKVRLGSGGMGEVYLAEHLLLRRPCAVKLIRAEQAGDPTTMHRFEREVQAMATLTHPNTVEIYDFGHADDGTFYYVMEYLPGSNLDHLVTRYGPLTPGRAIHFLRQVCGALREAHERGLLHRDIKPSNVLACERGGVYDVAKLLDFGLVQESALDNKEADRLTIQGTILGSPPYMSPEQAMGRPGLDGRSDIYSLGAVGYFLLTGQPPFVRETAMEVLLAHAYETPVPPSQVRAEVPADLEAVVLRCLEKDPARRYPDAHALAQALARCQDATAWAEDEAAGWWGQHGQPVPGAADAGQVVTATLKVVADGTPG